jgi:glycosyltransferase involved in cell wall biosynthesis
MRQRKIFILSPGGIRARGGMGRMVAYFTRRLALTSDLKFAVLDTYGPRVNSPSARLTMPFYFLWAISRLFAACLCRRVSLAHIHMAAFGSVYRKLTALLVCRLFRVPVVMHIHGGNLDRFCAGLSGPQFRLVQTLMAQASEIVVLGEYWRRLLVDIIGISPERVTVLYNGLAAPEAVPQRGVHETCELLFLGGVTREKGMDELMAALASPAMASARWRMTIAGDGPLLPHYRGEAERLAIADKVTFAGWVDEPTARQLLARSDALVLPSHFECLPMAVIEAMAFGLAVVATPVGAVPEAVIDGETGLLVPVRDPEQLASALRRIVADPALRRRLGAQAQAQFRRQFDIEIFNDRLTSLYRRRMLVG